MLNLLETFKDAESKDTAANYNVCMRSQLSLELPIER